MMVLTPATTAAAQSFAPPPSGENGLRLYKRDGAKGRERMLVDLDPWVEQTGRPYAFSSRRVPPGRP